MKGINKKINLKNNKEQSKINVPNVMRNVGLVMSGAALTSALLSSVMCDVAEIFSNISMDKVTEIVYASDDYQTMLTGVQAQLSDDFIGGKLTYEEYDKACKDLHSEAGIASYLESIDDEKLLETFEKSNQSKEIAKTIYNECLPTYLKGTVAGLGVMAAGAVIDSNNKKKKETQKELGAEE